MKEPDFSSIVQQIRKEDARYDARAYYFLRQGLDHTVREMKKKSGGRMQRSSHVSGPELLHGLREYALEQYGPMAKVVLNEWGVTRCPDFGELVFNLIDYQVFSKTEEDRREDFSDIYSFEEAFEKPFLPRRGPPKRRQESQED